MAYFDLRFEDCAFLHKKEIEPTQKAFYIKHVHFCYELIYFVSGDIGYSVEGRRYDVRKGDVLLIKPGEYHFPIFPEGGSFECYVIRFEDSALSPCVIKELRTLDGVYYVEDTFLPKLFQKLDKQVLRLTSTQNDVFLEPLLKSTLTQIAIFLCTDRGAIKKPAYTSEVAKQIIKYINDNLTSINVADDIAKGLCMSKSLINQTFFAELRMPIMRYVRNKKCLMAKHMITVGTPPTEAAFLCGFADYSSFYRAYVKTFGISPSGKKKG